MTGIDTIVERERAKDVESYHGEPTAQELEYENENLRDRVDYLEGRIRIILDRIGECEEAHNNLQAAEAAHYEALMSWARSETPKEDFDAAMDELRRAQWKLEGKVGALVIARDVRLKEFI